MGWARVQTCITLVGALLAAPAQAQTGAVPSAPTLPEATAPARASAFPASAEPAPAAPASVPPGGPAPVPVAPAPAPASVTLASPILTCKTLSELLLWDNKATEGEVLRRTVAEQTCRNLPSGTVVTVTETATIRDRTYQCLRVGADECVWAGAVHR